MKISFITTVFNEEKTIEKLLKSLSVQTKLPDEVIIVDGGSTDNTMLAISHFMFPILNKKMQIITKKGNRSVGRNEAIKHARGDIIVCSDSGNILDKEWIKNITEPFVDSSVAVVAGYYKGLANTIFQKCVIPYALVMPDKVNSQSFLPATRSVAFRKSIWKKVGGFDERLSHNEDYVFAKALQRVKTKIIFAKDAIVYWVPRSSLKQVLIMFFRFAYGDAEAKIYRPKVFILFLRYSVAILSLALEIIYHNFVLLTLLLFLLLLYILWAIGKNYRYVKHPAAFIYLPVLQFTADFAVLGGTLYGILGLWGTKKTS